MVALTQGMPAASGVPKIGLSEGKWCPEEDSNLHTLASTST